MIRTTAEAPFFGLWRDADRLRSLAYPHYLTTARYEPILRRQHGGGHIDLLFESDRQSCVLAGIRLDASNLITRERPPCIWPAYLTAILDESQLRALEDTIVPWLRSLARAQSMPLESIRRYVPSERFDRARAAELFGAASLDRTLLRMAPFVYARRFAAGERVVVGGTDAALGQAVLADVAAFIERLEPDAGAADDAFACDWYGITPARRYISGTPHVAITDGRDGPAADIAIDLRPTAPLAGALIPIPSPVPWDLLFSFDTADAPAAAHFTVSAPEAPLREPAPVSALEVRGGSTGTIVLAVSNEAFMMRGADIEEAEVLAHALIAEGFSARVCGELDERTLAGAQLIHIFGAPFEPHTIAFAEHARSRGIEFVFDLPPTPADPSAFLENTLHILHRAAFDDADIGRYMEAFEVRRLDPIGAAEPSAEDFARIEARFGQLAGHAAAVIAAEEDLERLRATLPSTVTNRITSRCAFGRPEPPAAPIAHIAPTRPFALVHGGIATRSHALYTAIAAERLAIPLVIAGTVYDVNYLQTLRAAAPNAIVLADADAGTVSALYRRAAIWVDAAPRPRSFAHLVRAVACGALPVLARESPLARIAGGDAPVFSLSSVDDCARTLQTAIASPNPQALNVSLRARLLSRRDSALAFHQVLAAYSNVATVV